jgi:hypothetical protein
MAMACVSELIAFPTPRTELVASVVVMVSVDCPET